MPLNCPRDMFEYNDCLGCRHRSEKECLALVTVSRPLSDILTMEERINILEDRKENPAVNIVTITKEELRNWQRSLIFLTEKVQRMEVYVSKIKAKKGKDMPF